MGHGGGVDRPTNQPTNQPTSQRTDIVTYRVTCAQFKRLQRLGFYSSIEYGKDEWDELTKGKNEPFSSDLLSPLV